MRIHFRETPWDLYLSVAFAIVMSAILLVFKVGNFLALPLVLFMPGYVLLAALFPISVSSRRTGIDWIERVVFSIGLSVAVAPLLGLLINSTPYGIRFVSIVTAITLWTCAVGAIAYWRRMGVSPENRLSLTIVLTLPSWEGSSPLDKSLTIALTASVIVAGGTFAYVVLFSHSPEPFTEFFILGPDGNASGYPTVLNVSQAGTVIVGIANHETTTIDFTIRIDLVGVRIIRDPTSGLNETFDVNRSTLAIINVTLSNGQNWTQPYIFRIDVVGLWKAEFSLFRTGDLLHTFRQLHFFVTVQ